MTKSRRAIIAERLSDLRAEMSNLGLDALIVPRFDAHQGEYVAPHDERLGFVTGFTGSAGAAIVTSDGVRLFVDGRYTVQAQNQCPADLIHRDHLFENPPENWLADVAKDDWSIGYDAMLLPPAWVGRFERALVSVGATLKPLASNPVDRIWVDQPAEPFGQITAFPLQFAGVSIDEKRDFLLKILEQEAADIIVETQPDNIAWLLNVRGDDVAFNPMPQSFLVMDKNGSGDWFVDRAKFEEGLSDTLPAWLTIHPKASFLEVLEKQICEGARVVVDPDFSPAAVTQLVAATNAEPVHKPSPVTLAKAHKNSAELEGLRACHLEDAVAWAEFSAWLHASVPVRAASGNPVTEFEAEQRILACRQARPGFLSESFRTISCAGSNAAMCHYAADPQVPSPVLTTAPYLLDSGGQYETGTTDATRSYSFRTVAGGLYGSLYRSLQGLGCSCNVALSEGNPGPSYRRDLPPASLGSGAGLRPRYRPRHRPSPLGSRATPAYR